MNALEKLADWIAHSNRQHTQANLDRATNSFIDTLGCNLSGLEEPVVSKAYQSVQATSAGNVTAFGFGQTSAASAALVNATASHSQDFDDYNRSSVAHTSTVLIPTALAVAALNRSVTSQHFLDEVIEDATVKAIMERVIVKPYRVDPALDDLSPEVPDVIRVYLNNGTELEKTVAISRGSPEKPLTRAQLFEKFRHCINSENIDVQPIEDEFNRFAQAESIMPLIRQLKLLAA